MTPDIINGGFEFVGSMFTWASVARVYKDKGYAGIYLPAIVFFTGWGAWNIYYYPTLNQYWSLAGGISIFIANICWISLMAYFGRKA